MRKVVIFIAAAMSIIAAARPCDAADANSIALFNGKDFDGWTAVISRPELKLEDIWSVAPGGILVCKGNRPDKVRGYIRTTRDDFHDYTLTLQFAEDKVEITASEASGLIRNGHITGVRKP